MLKVTSSWDDGDILDTRLSDLLLRYGIKGTFYISKNYRAQRISDQNIKNISKYHEIGAHTLTHPDLRILSPEKAREEIEGSKKWLEEIINAEVKMFCYPKGRYDDTAVVEVKKAGFTGARTTELGSLEIKDPYFMPVTLQVYPVHWRSFKQRAPGLLKLGTSIFSMYSWLSMSKGTFDMALKKGGIFHLFGHSWEIEKYNMWSELEKFFQYIGNKKDCVYLMNSELIA
ncbi:MAG: polysaccharide deacetylase family protein [Candidatus Zambryskibacteria bacterium]|nr:polysaccharide deacetylase family protein [Candidatus Zambryskibacteria bacterium]